MELHTAANSIANKCAVTPRALQPEAQWSWSCGRTCSPGTGTPASLESHHWIHWIHGCLGVQFQTNHDKLLGGWALPLWKLMEWVTVGMMTFPIYGEQKCINMFQTTNQQTFVIKSRWEAVPLLGKVATWPFSSLRIRLFSAVKR